MERNKTVWIKKAYQDERQVKIGIIAGRPVTGKVKSVSQLHFVVENEYSETVIDYSEVLYVTVYFYGELGGEK